MAETTGIGWTRSTFNPWIGCTKVSPGCDHCYASVSTPARTLGVTWGAGQPRRRTSEANWRQPLKWNAEAARTGEFWPVFCASLADVFDNEVDPTWRRDLFELIGETPHLTWLLLTKRIGNATKLLPRRWGEQRIFPENVWLGATIVNQEEADRDIPKLLAVPAAKRFLSMEPLLGMVDVFSEQTGELLHQSGDEFANDHIDWIIVGGESNQRGMKARPFDVEWARSTIRQCKAAGVAVWVKQFGSFVIDRNDADFDGSHAGAWPDHIEREGRIDFAPFNYVERAQGAACRVRLRDRAGADPAEWPEDLRVQEFPA